MLNNKTQESWINHTWLAIHGPCMANYTLVINLKCFCFPILFPYNGYPLFPYFQYCMDFCYEQKIPETLKFEMFVYSHIFSLLWEFTFSIFWELYGFLLHPKYLRNPTFRNICFFPIHFLYYENSLFPYFGNCMDFCFIRSI